MRWNLTCHFLSQYSKSMKERSGIKAAESSFIHQQVSAASMQHDEKDAQALIEHVIKSMTNPFDVDSHPEQVLVNIVTGPHANPEVQKSLLSAIKN